MEMMACPNLAVPAEVMQHVVNVESSRNPFAIGVVGAQLVRQPQNLGEAVATVRMLEEKGYNYSLGVAQVNRANFGKYGLDTYEKAFEICPNLVAGSQILAQCYASAGGDWGKAFSCYYSGNFTTGYQDGYVQKIFDSMARQSLASTASPIPIQLINSGASKAATKGAPVITSDSGAYRVAIRSVADAALSATVVPAMAAAVQASPVEAQTQDPAAMARAAIAAGASMRTSPVGPYGNYAAPPAGGRIPTDAATAALMDQVGAPYPQGSAAAQPGRIPTDPATAAIMSQVGAPSAAPSNQPTMAGAVGDDVFVPAVRGPNDPVPSQAPATAGAANAAPARPGADGADLRQGGSDGAFVF